MSAAALVREAGERDLAAVQAIYARHVRHSAANFELEPPAVEEIGRRRQAALAAGLPYLVAELDGAVGGFAALTPYRPRPAYRWTVEDSVYVAPAVMRRGLGRALLAELIERGAALGCRQVIAVIGDDANDASIRLHEALGFARAGVLRAVGYKHGRWIDTVLMQRRLGAGDGGAPAGG